MPPLASKNIVSSYLATTTDRLEETDHFIMGGDELIRND